MTEVSSVDAPAFAGPRPPVPLEEEELVQGAKARSPEAWSEVFNRHYRQLYVYALSRLHDPSAAEDVAASVFLEALKSIDSYTYRGRPLLAWLYRIARNVVTDHIRSQGGRTGRKSGPARGLLHFLGGRNEDGREMEPVAPASLDGLGGDAQRIDLKRALEGLTGEQREVIALHYFAGFSLREVAQLLGKKERSIYSLQARGLAALRRRLR